MRLILFLLSFYLLTLLFRIVVPTLVRLFLKNAVKKGGEVPRREAHDMICCSRCGTFVSKGAILSKFEKSFCSEKCRDSRNEMS